ncbi:MAG: AraC family transcriptional regulator [Eubacteriales bacterium]
MGIRKSYPERNFVYEFDEELWYLGSASKTNVLSIEMSGITNADPTYHIYRSARADTYVLEYVLRGRGSIDSTGKHYELHGGDTYLLRRFTEHSYRSSPEDPFVKVWVNVSGTLIDHLLDAYNLLDPVIVRHVHLYPYFLRLREVTDKGYDAAAAERILAELLIAFAHGGEITEARNLTVPEQIKNYIDQNTMNGITTEKAAAQFGISPAHARRLFREQYGITVHRYICERQLMTAKQLLMTSAYSVGEISDLLGYCDDNYFSYVFKKNFGLSPMQFRIQNKKQAAENAESR